MTEHIHGCIHLSTTFFDHLPCIEANLQAAFEGEGDS